MLRTEWRAVFVYPSYGSYPERTGYGPPRDTEAEALEDRPLRPEETWGRRVGVQTRSVTEWNDVVTNDDRSVP